MAETHGTENGRRQAALAWLVTLNGAPSPAARRDFAAWRADPANRAAFAEAEALWRRAAQPAAELAREEQAWLAPLLAGSRPRPRRRAFRWAIVSFCAVLLGFGVWLERPGLLQDLRADHATRRGERQSLALPDGSTAILDADTAVAIRFSGTERRIALMRGAAYFEVTPGQAPFVVEAASGEVRVLGTRFGVTLTPAGATVTVASGRVEVRPPVGAPALLGRGQQLRYRSGGAGPVTPVDPDQALAWRDGRLAFQQATLAEVVAAIGRHRAGRILILDAELAGRRVTGSFPAGDTEAALASLQAILGFRRQDLTPHLVTLR
jgi:transmembrane sensor